jgi:hypothetical protein
MRAGLAESQPDVQTPTTTAAAQPQNTPPEDQGLTLPDIAAHFPELELLSILGRGGMGVVFYEITAVQSRIRGENPALNFNGLRKGFLNLRG